MNIIMTQKGKKLNNFSIIILINKVFNKYLISI